jgi:hypothetical protein
MKHARARIKNARPRILLLARFDGSIWRVARSDFVLSHSGVSDATINPTNEGSNPHSEDDPRHGSTAAIQRVYPLKQAL